MTLGFSIVFPKGKLKGKPTLFPEKILAGMLVDFEKKGNESLIDVPMYIHDYGERVGYMYVDDILEKVDSIKDSKIHTIRQDKNNRWKEGNDIHFVINNRTKNRFQFAPIVKCTGVQTIEITYDEGICEKYCGEPTVIIDGKFFSIWELEQFAINDGFDSIEDFCKYFNEDFKGKIIHWTDLRY